MMPAAGVPWRPLAGLTAFVLLAHWLALRAGTPATIAWQRAPAARALLLSPVPVAAPAAAAAPTAAPAAARPRIAPPAIASPAPAADRASAVDSAASEAVPLPPSPALAAVAVPGAAVWHYEVSARQRGQPVGGSGTLLWRHDGHQYEARLQLDAPPLPARVQRSIGRLGAGGLEPTRFSDRLRSEEAAHFDRERGRIVFSSNRPDAPLDAGAQDRLSVLLQLAALVAGDPRHLVAGSTVSLQTVGTRDAEVWTFVVDGPETVALPAGSVAALKMTRAPQREYDLRLELWLGPGPDYAPVRLRLTPPNGDWLDWQWSGTDKG